MIHKGEKRLLGITTRKSGKNKGRKEWWYDYIEGDIMAINAKDLTT